MDFPRLQTYQRFAPTTFVERGAQVPFTTPALQGTRVRMNDRDKLELLLPAFSGGFSHFVVPWKAIPEIVRLTMHDRALHAEIARNEICTPLDIRLAALEVAGTGLGGAELAEAARRTLEQDKAQRIAAHFHLLVRFLRGVGLDTSGMMALGLDTDVGQRAARQALSEAGGRLGMPVERLHGRLSELSSLVAPVGLAGGDGEGRLRGLLRRLEGFRAGVAHWGDEATADRLEGGAIAGFCADATDRVVRLATRDLTQFDRPLESLDLLLQAWPQAPVELRRLVTHLSWLLDGWAWLIQRWDETVEFGRHEQTVALAEILTFLPTLPKSEAARLEGDPPPPLLGGLLHQKWVKTYEEWRGRQLDLELIERIETRKAALA